MADKTATLEFDEYPDKAYIVRLSPVPMEEYFEIAEQADAASGLDDIRSLADRFHAAAFVGWEGHDTEPTVENFRRLDLSLILGIIRQWVKAVAGVPLPLPRTSGAGGPSKVRRASKSRRR